MVTMGCEVKDDEEMIEVLIAMARMRVIEMFKPERPTSSQRSRGNWREAKAERRKTIQYGKILDMSFLLQRLFGSDIFTQEN